MHARKSRFWLFTMLSTAITVFLAGQCAQAEGRTLELHLKLAAPLDVEANHIMQSELQQLLRPAEIEITFRDHPQVGESFDWAVVGTIRSGCSLPKAAKAAKAQSAIHLADTFVSSDGILPFFEVNCGEVVRLLGKEPESGPLGRALAHVIAHELYHIIAKTDVHSNAGIAKSAFSIKDLVTPELAFDMTSLALMRAALPALRFKEAAQA